MSVDQPGVRIAADRGDILPAQQVDDLVRVRPQNRNVAQTDKFIDIKRLQLGQNDLKRVMVAVDITNDPDARHLGVGTRYQVHV